jgi:hypothetical protein
VVPPRYGRYTKAAIVHDHLWREEVPRSISRIEADGIFRQAMRELDVPFLPPLDHVGSRQARRTGNEGRRHGWWREAPRVLLVAILALPFLLPPAVLVMLVLVLFWVIEWLVYLPLKPVERATDETGAPAPKRQCSELLIEDDVASFNYPERRSVDLRTIGNIHLRQQLLGPILNAAESEVSPLRERTANVTARREEARDVGCCETLRRAKRGTSPCGRASNTSTSSNTPPASPRLVRSPIPLRIFPAASHISRCSELSSETIHTIASSSRPA